MAFSGLRLEIGTVLSATERPVKMWTHLLERELSLKCEGLTAELVHGSSRWWGRPQSKSMARSPRVEKAGSAWLLGIHSSSPCEQSVCTSGKKLGPNYLWYVSTVFKPPKALFTTQHILSPNKIRHSEVMYLLCHLSVYLLLFWDNPLKYLG